MIRHVSWRMSLKPWRQFFQLQRVQYRAQYINSTWHLLYCWWVTFCLFFAFVFVCFFAFVFVCCFGAAFVLFCFRFFLLLMPWSHLNVQPSRKTHILFCHNFAKRSGTYIACGSYRVYVVVTGPMWVLLEGCHVHVHPHNSHVATLWQLPYGI